MPGTHRRRTSETGRRALHVRSESPRSSIVSRNLPGASTITRIDGGVRWDEDGYGSHAGDSGAVIRVSGVLSGDTADEFITILRTTLAYEPKDVVLDLRNVTELGMRGVSGLIAARRLCGRADAVMDIIASVAVEHALDSAHVTGLFRFTDPN